MAKVINLHFNQVHLQSVYFGDKKRKSNNKCHGGKGKKETEKKQQRVNLHCLVAPLPEQWTAISRWQKQTLLVLSHLTVS